MNLSLLQGHIPDSILAELHGLDIFEVNNELRMAHLLGQCKLESQNFTHFSENLNYTHPKRLIAVFPSIFKTIPVAQEYCNNPEKLGNEVYSNRLGNGDNDSGDGYNYRGRGAIGITGRANYQSLTDDSGIDFISNPDLLATDFRMFSAGWFFHKFGLNAIADKGATYDVCATVTRRVNGNAMLGLEQRAQYTEEFYKILTA